MTNEDTLNPVLNNRAVAYLPIGSEAVSRSIVAGATPKTNVPEYWEGGTIPWMSSGEVNKGTVVAVDRCITQEGFDSCSTKLVPPTAVVVALAGQGKTRGLVARTRIELCTNQSLASIIPGPSMNPDFLFYFLQSRYKQLREISSGDGTRGGLNLKMIREYRVPVPPLEIQREIVDILDRFSKLEAELEAELEARERQYAYLRDSYFSTRQSSEWVALRDCGSFVRGKGIQKSDFVDTGLPAVHYGQIHTQCGVTFDVAPGQVSEELYRRSNTANCGDVILATTSEDDDAVAKASAWLGEQSIAVSGDAMIFQHELVPSYVSHYFASECFQRQKRPHITGTKVRRISIASLEKISIPVPSPEEQRRIAAILDRFDALVNDMTIGLPAEIAARRKQYEYYRDRLLSFPDVESRE